MALHRRQDPLIKQGWVRALLLFVVYLVVTIVISVVVSLFVYVSNTNPNATAGAEAILAIPSLIFIVISFLASVASVFICRKYIDRRSFISLGLQPGSIFPDGLFGFSAGLFLIALGGLLIYLFNGLQWVDISFDGADFFTSIILLALVAFSEELVFRGYIMKNLRKSFNQWVSLAVSSCLFAIVHATNPGIPLVGIVNIFFGGLVLGLTCMYTRNLWAPIFFHFGWNLFQGPVLGFPVSGLPFGSVLTAEETPDTFLNGGGFGFEGSVVCSLLLISSAAALVILYINKNRPALRS